MTADQEEREYTVEVHTTHRELYVVSATSPEDAAARWSQGVFALDECIGVDNIYSVTEEA